MGIDAKVIQAGLFNTTSTAQDRREMLEEIMRKGSSSLGTDVPSEWEINRLAARWLFEKLDEERRQRENYRSRLMEDHEVPEWVYTMPDMKDGREKGSMNEVAVTGKRRIKEVIRDDTVTDLQWMKAVENGNDVTIHSAKRVQEKSPLLNNELPKYNARDNLVGEKRVLDLKSETVSTASETRSEDTFGSASQRSRNEVESSHINNTDDGLEGGLNGLTWKAYKRKRSSLM